MAELKINKTGVGFLIDASAKTYETLEKQIREFISNSLDAKATKVKMEFIPQSNTIIITDNGCGMDKNEFEENYLVIGCSEKYGDPNTIGRIGVGKFSAIPLCDTLIVRTKKSNNNKIYHAKLDLKQLRDPENRTKDISTLVLGSGEYVDSAVDDPDVTFSPNNCFTKMTLKGVPTEVRSSFTDINQFNELTRNLGRILPLKYNKESAAIKNLSKIDPELSEKLSELSNNRNINIIIHSPLHPQGFELYRSLFGDNFALTNQSIFGDVYPIKSPDDTSPAPIRIIGYLADMTTGSQNYYQWKGLNIRLQNTTVTENEFFDYNDTPAQARITGEIQIINVNEEELITMNRAGFVTSYPQYTEIRNWLTEQLKDFGKSVIRKRTEFNSNMKKKSTELRIKSNVAESLERSINEVFLEEKVDLNLLSKGKLKIADEIDQEQVLLESYPDEILQVIPVPQNAATEIKSEPVQGKFVIRVPENYLEYKITIDDEEYQIKYVDHSDEEPFIDVDTNDKTIRINNNSPPVKNGTQALVLALILYEYAFAAYPDNIILLKEKIYEALMCAFRD